MMQILTPFYVFQIFAVALWLWDDYHWVRLKIALSTPAASLAPHSVCVFFSPSCAIAASPIVPSFCSALTNRWLTASSSYRARPLLLLLSLWLTYYSSFSFFSLAFLGFSNSFVKFVSFLFVRVQRGVEFYSLIQFVIWINSNWYKLSLSAHLLYLVLSIELNLLIGKCI